MVRVKSSLDFPGETHGHTLSLPEEQGMRGAAWWGSPPHPIPPPEQVDRWEPASGSLVPGSHPGFLEAARIYGLRLCVFGGGGGLTRAL